MPCFFCFVFCLFFVFLWLVLFSLFGFSFFCACFLFFSHEFPVISSGPPRCTQRLLTRCSRSFGPRRWGPVGGGTAGGWWVKTYRCSLHLIRKPLRTKHKNLWRKPKETENILSILCFFFFFSGETPFKIHKKNQHMLFAGFPADSLVPFSRNRCVMLS